MSCVSPIFIPLFLIFGQLSYLPSSSGFYNNPVLEGGRTEIEFADIDGDGNPDILSIGDHGSPYINTQEHGIMVWFGDGQGNWNLYQYGNFGYGGIAIGDVNGDGRWDVGYGMHHNYASEDLGDDMLEVALGDGTGRMWYPWDDSLVRGGTVWGMFSTDFADVDHDGDLDVGSCSFGYGVGLRVFLNLGNGTWQRSWGTPESVNCAMEFYFRDVNRDGNPDIISGAAGPAVYFGDGTGNFYPGDSGLPRSNYGLEGISAGDVDNDGGADIAFVTASGGIQVWRWNQGAGVWENFSNGLPFADTFYATQLADMNRDGFTDLLGLHRRYVKLWAGDGAGNWRELATVNFGQRAVDWSAFRAGCDFDHNGYPDFALIIEQGTWPNYRNYAYAYREASPKESLRIFPVFPRGGERFWSGSAGFIDWWSEAPTAESTRVRLELSVTGLAGPWSLIADSLPNNGRAQWQVPANVNSGNCYIRYTVYKGSESHSAVTPRAFFIGDPTGIQTEKAGVYCKNTAPPCPYPVPNPARNTVKVVFPSVLLTPVSLEMCDVSGRVLKTFHLCPGIQEFVLPTAHLSTGTYFLVFGDQGAVKLLIQR